MGAKSAYKKRVMNPDHGFTDIVLSWSIEDILNEDLYKHQVGRNLFLHYDLAIYVSVFISGNLIYIFLYICGSCKIGFCLC